MYLAQKRVKEKYHFFIRESYKDGHLFRSRELFQLGPDPSRYIIYPGGNAFFIDERVTEALEDKNVQSFSEELEDVFWPFLELRIRRILEPFRQPAISRTLKNHGAKEDDTHAFHTFDKRRICYLKCGRVNEGIMAKFPSALFRRLQEKSRDEIEQGFIRQECNLRPSECRAYTYAVFDLQRFFSESFAKENPQWLDQNKVEKHFLKEICCLHKDPAFWVGEGLMEGLHEYLQRYVIMFFDNDYQHTNPLNDYVRDFMNRHRFRHGAPKKDSISIKRASMVFGVKEETLKTMTKKGITRYYRRLAKKMHPDKGGTEKKFVELTEVYHALLAKRR